MKSSQSDVILGYTSQLVAGRKSKSVTTLLARPGRSRQSPTALVGTQNGTTLTEGNLAILNKIA